MRFTLRLVLFSTACFLMVLSGCSLLRDTLIEPTGTKSIMTIGTSPNAVLWMGDFSNPSWRSVWRVRRQGAWGTQNMTAAPGRDGFSNILRVNFPAGSASPAASRQENAPVGGGQFFATLGIAPQTALRLSYYVQFCDDFDFVKGGKLPGLFGGSGNSGGDIPNGQDGFSTRLMWRTDGAGEVYAYLPTSQGHGTSIGRGKWYFQPGVWHHIEQEVVLNRPNTQSGRIRVWLDGAEVLDQGGLTFRTTNNLKIEGIFFSTFFGGDDTSWATPRSVYADFADFSVSAVAVP